jgi:hypothetical protein
MTKIREYTVKITICKPSLELIPDGVILSKEEYDNLGDQKDRVEIKEITIPDELLPKLLNENPKLEVLESSDEVVSAPISETEINQDDQDGPVDTNESSDDEVNLETTRSEWESLFGSKPHFRKGVAKLQEEIDAKKAEIASEIEDNTKIVTE